MLKLDTTTRKIQAVLGDAVTTNQLPCTVGYSDDNGTTYVGGTQLTNTNSTTAVDICAAPGASTVRDIDYLSIRNRDTAAATVTVMLDDNGTDYEIVKATLAVGDQLIYTHSGGWNTIDSVGQIKSSATGGGGVSDGDKGDITVSGSGTVWTVDNQAITYAKMQNTAGSDIFLGRVTSGAGSLEEMTPTEARTILNVADGATANSSDATLLARANHTGTQNAATISDFTAAAQTAAPAETDTSIGTLIAGATAKTTPIDADTVGISDSAASNILKKLSWANIKATLVTYFDTLYSALGHTHSGVYEPANPNLLETSDIGVSVQAYDADLATLAGLTATTDNFIQSKASAWASRTPTQVTADLIAMVGDSGAGGTKGLVPAPGAGDAGKYLRGDATWGTPSGGGGGGTPSWLIKTTAYTAAAGEAIMADTSGGAWTLTLPASPSADDVVHVADYAGTFATYNLTVARNSQKIMGLSEDMTVSDSNASFTLTYIDATKGWAVI